MGKKASNIEVVDVEDRPRELEAILRHYMQRVRANPSAFTGMMIVMEQPGGAFEMKYSGTSNAAERIGRLEILKDAMLDSTSEDSVEDRTGADDDPAGFQGSVARRRRGD